MPNHRIVNYFVFKPSSLNSHFDQVGDI